MCGLVAIFDKTLNVSGRNLFESLLYHGVVRGPHSTGIASITKTGCEVFKKAVPSYDFLEMSSAASVIKDADYGLIGHNRFATMGAKTSRNAHPFQIGDITLVHNGTLTNKYSLPDSKYFDTDSETICNALSLTDEYVPVLESLEGAYALIWYNSANGCVYIARNEERDLHCFVTKKSQKDAPSYVLCSEKEMGEWVIGRDKVYDIESSFGTPVGVLYCLNITSGEVTKENFTPKKVTAGHQWRGGAKYQPTTMRVVVDWQDQFRIYCTSMDGKYDIILPKVSHKLAVQQDFVLEGEVSSTSNTNAWLRPGSIKIITGLRPKKRPAQHQSLSCTCAICGTDITDDDWVQDNWDVYKLNGENEVAHLTCTHELAAAVGGK